ncbi:MAG: hypothetical protein ACLQBY_07080 [Solirubrobacteraceae bacterium]
MRDGRKRSVDQTNKLWRVVGIILGLHFQDTVDPTAIATLLLAGATVGLAISAWRALKASQSEIEEMRDQGARAHRPVIIPVFDHSRMDLGPLGTTERMPKLTDGKTLVVPTENIGAGPALCLCATAELLPAAGAPSDARACSEPTKLIGVAKTSFVLLELDVHDWSAGASFRLVVNYEDLLGELWRTVGEWHAESKRWTRVGIEPREKARKGPGGGAHAA